MSNAVAIRATRAVHAVLLAALVACGSNATGVTNGHRDGSASGDGSGGAGSDGGSGGDGRAGRNRDGGHGSNGDGGSIILTGNDSGISTGDAACASVKKKAASLPVDLVFGIDESFSMAFENKWTDLTGALDSFVADPASSGLDMGIQFFPLRETCVVSAYEDLAVPVGPQASVAPLIQQAIAMNRPSPSSDQSGGEPIVQILEGLVGYLQANTAAGYKPVIVLATDGIPDTTCSFVPDGGLPNSLANAETVAAAAFAGTPSIPTFVIGVGSNLTALNGLAAAGGTGMATIINVGDAGSSEQAFIDALNAIRVQAVPCQFAIPTGTTVNPSETNVDYTKGSGATETFVYVGTSASCSMAPNDGWYFDNPTSPTEVILCSGACNTVKNDPAATVDVVLGCPRNNLK